MTGYLTPEDFNPRSYKRSDYDGYHRALHPQISIHAPTRGATVNPKHYIGCTYFNPRSYKRSDMGNSRTQIVHSISIHAPTRGATNWGNNAVQTVQFQSTLLQEERHYHLSPTKTVNDFNPRSYKRSDIQHHSKRVSFTISIHAPTRGATLLVKLMPMLWVISIHAPTRGATLWE